MSKCGGYKKLEDNWRQKVPLDQTIWIEFVDTIKEIPNIVEIIVKGSPFVNTWEIVKFFGSSEKTNVVSVEMNIKLYQVFILCHSVVMKKIGGKKLSLEIPAIHGDSCIKYS